ncbi:MAG: hypothetical protein KAQ64_04255 [Candidatus Pacebacteria bacterium]|nr:hypothetical protein [Candidatus Paceibacterota bacterium]
MEMRNFENNPVLENKIEYNNNEMIFCSKRGGIIKSMKIDGVELFYFDKERFNDPEQSDRGGAPELYPFAGPPTKEGPFSELSQHGFARDLSWTIEKNEEGEFVEVLKSNDETREMYPYDFELRLRSKMDEDGAITLTQEVENKSEKEMPISMGLHPYFNVPEGKKEEIKFDFEGGNEIENALQDWLENPDKKNEKDFLRRIDNPKEEIKINIPGIGTIKMDISEEYEKIWIWTERDKNFICIEPVMRDNKDGKIVDGPKMIKKDKTFSASVKYGLED